MFKLSDISNERKNKIVFWTKWVLIVYTMLISVPFLQDQLYFAKKLACAWMLLVGVFLITADFRHYKTKEYLLAGIFCAFYGITILSNRQYHFINEVLILGFTLCLYFMLTYCDFRMTRERAEKQMECFALTVIAVTFVFSVINIVMYFAIYAGVLKIGSASSLHGVIGSQLGGIYNPNTGGTFNWISMAFSVYFLLYRNKKNAFLYVNLFVQLWCFSLVQSRGAWVCLLAFVVLYFVFVWEKKSLKTLSRIAAKAGMTVISCILLMTVCSQVFLNVSLSIARASMPSDDILQSENGTENPDDEEGGISTDNRDMTNSDASDLTTGRSILWKVGLQALGEKPVFGIGYRRIDDALKAGLTEAGYKNSAGGGLHNIFITVLVSCGITGGLIFLAMTGFLLIKVLKIYLCKTMPSRVKFMATLIPVWLTGELVESRITLSLTFLSVFFWIFAGYVLYYAKECNAND